MPFSLSVSPAQAVGGVLCLLAALGGGIWLGREAKPIPSVAVKKNVKPLTEAVARAPYRWDSVRWGGGSVTGIAVHPSATKSIYLRTDMGTGYRWDAAAMRWRGILDGISYEETDLYGPESVAVDPSDKSGNTVFYALGRYAQDWARPSFGDLTKSTDGGQTWRRAGLKLSVASNDDQKWGERLAVDPLSGGRRVVYASRGEGLWVSDKSGEPGSWRREATAPTGDITNRRERKPSGLTFFVYDATAGVINGRSRRAYIGAWNVGVYRTTDAGKTWALIPDSPRQSHRAAVGRDGALTVTSETGVFRKRGAETAFADITPEGFAGKSFVAVASDPKNAKHLMTAAHDWKYHQPIFRSTDGGETWRKFDFKDITRDFGDVTYFARREWLWAGAPSAMTFDPATPNAAYMTDWNGPWYCADVSAAKPKWTLLMRGHEQGVTLLLRSTPQGAPLLFGAMDADGYRIRDVTKYPDGSFSDFGPGGTNETTGLDFCEADPSYVVRVGANGWHAENGGKVCYSVDNGQSWKQFPTVPEGAWGGQIAVSATDRNNTLWLPAQGKTPQYTTDGGKTWKNSTGVPAGTIPGDAVMHWNGYLASDRVLPGTFYILHGGIVHKSSDGGRSFVAANETTPLNVEGVRGVRTLRSSPGLPGNLYVSLDTRGVWHSTDGGTSWARVANVDQSYLFAIGKAKSGTTIPAMFVLGQVAGERGLFRSDDNGVTWVKINTDREQFGTANAMEGDRQTWGRVYLGSNGRGIFYGQPR